MSPFLLPAYSLREGSFVLNVSAASVLELPGCHQKLRQPSLFAKSRNGTRQRVRTQRRGCGAVLLPSAGSQGHGVTGCRVALLWTARHMNFSGVRANLSWSV